MYFALPYTILLRFHRAAIDARRRERTWRFFAYSVAAGLCAALMIALAFSISYALYRGGLWPLSIAVMVLVVEPVAHAHVVRHVLVPLGWYRAAFWTAHFSTMRDSDAYGLVCAALAHATRPTPTGEAWIAARRDRRLPLGDAEIAATALIAAGRGDAATARQLFRSLEHIVEVHPEVRELVGEWLACDAAERGAWDELAADAAVPRWPATALTYLLEGIARARTGAAHAPRAAELRARWLLAPHRRATRELLAAARPAPRAIPRTESDPAAGRGAPDAAPGAPLARAIAAHLDLSGAPATSDRLAHAATSWDLALADDAIRSWLARRALELDCPLGAVDRALAEVAGAITEELARAAERAALAAPPVHGPISQAIARRLRHGRLDALESGFTRWADRRKNGEALAAIDEWREWVALRSAYEAAAAAGGTDLRRLAFPHAYTTGTSMAVWLWNTRKEYALSHAISAWLLREALAVGDAEAIDVCTRNASLGVPTRLGQVKPT